jgi:acetyl esterase/lipase
VGGSAAADPFDLTPYVNPELRPILKPLLAVTKAPLDAQTLASARLTMMRSQPPLPQPAWIEKVIPGPAGAPTVRIFVINGGAKAPPRAGILHIHGGGFVMGDARGAIRGQQEVARELDCVVVTVDYRLAPETRFPGALEDNYAALKWLHANADSLGVDRSRVAVAGESAGGGHAAMLAIAARDRGEFPLAYQALSYPMLDDRTGSTVKKPRYQGALIWPPEKNRFGWSSLLGVPAGSAHVPEGAVPARVANLHGLPPTFIGVGSIDLFVDEDLEYGRRLIDAGVPTTMKVYPGLPHAFDGVPGLTLAKQFRGDLIAALREGLKARG